MGEGGNRSRRGGGPRWCTNCGAAESNFFGVGRAAGRRPIRPTRRGIVGGAGIGMSVSPRLAAGVSLSAMIGLKSLASRLVA